MLANDRSRSPLGFDGPFERTAPFDALMVEDSASFPRRQVTPAEPVTGRSLVSAIHFCAAAIVAGANRDEESMRPRPWALESDTLSQAENGRVE